MSLDVWLTAVRPTEVYSGNVTHNLTRMAEAAGIYRHLWRPEELEIDKAHQLIEPLRAGLERLRADPQGFKRYDPENGWGDYDGLVAFVEAYLKACVENPDAEIGISR